MIKTGAKVGVKCGVWGFGCYGRGSGSGSGNGSGTGSGFGQGAGLAWDIGDCDRRGREEQGEGLCRGCPWRTMGLRA